jgi:methyl-accepting chemotaxis protein
LIYNLIYFFVIVLAIGVSLFLPLYFELSNPGLTPAQQGQVADKVLYLHGNLWPVIVVIFIILSIHSILVSHKIAGPLYRFRQTFQEIIEGNIAKMVKIRKGDFLVNEQTKIEEMMDMLRSRIGNIKNEQAAMEQVLKEIVGNHGSHLSEDLRSFIDKLEEHTSRIKREADYFRVSLPDQSDKE